MIDPSINLSHNTSQQPITSSPSSSMTLNSQHIPPTHSRRSQRSQRVSARIMNKDLEDIDNDDDQPRIEDEIKSEYFAPDPEESEEEDEEKSVQAKRLKNSAHETYFKPKVFIKFFIMHVLFFFFLGPLIILLAPIFGKIVLINQGFWLGPGINFPNQTFQYLCIVSFLVAYYVVDTKGLQAMEVYMMCIAVFLRIITISSKYAYQHEDHIRLMHTKKLTLKDLQGDLLLIDWRMQTDAIIEEEVQAAILRLEIDSSLFFFNFLGQINKSLREKLEKAKSLLRGIWNRNENENENANAKNQQVIAVHDSPSDQSTQRIESPKESTSPLKPNNALIKTEARKRLNNAVKKINNAKKLADLPITREAIFKSFSYFLESKKINDNHLYGYNLAFLILQRARNSRYNHLGKTLFAVSILHALIPTFYRIYLIYYKKEEDLSVLTDRPYIAVLLILINSLFFWFNSFILAVSVLDYESKVFSIKQIGFLISPRKISQFKDKKIYPTFNIFDPVTLKTWSNLRRVVIEYGKKYTLRSNFNAGVFILIYLLIFAILVLQLLGLVTAYSDPLLIIVFTFETLVYFIIFACIMLGVAFINNQFKVHKNLLKKNKTIISDFQRLSNLYVGEKAIEPDNYVYREGLRLLKKELGNDENFEEKLVARAEKLTAMIDDIMEELEFEEENEPFTVMGIPIDYNLLKTLAAGAISLLFALSQTMM